MMIEKLYVSRDGIEKMRSELAELNERRMKVAKAIEHARSLGDLSENAEYHSAKEEQAMLHARIADLENKLTRSVVLEDQDIDTDKAYLGATVRVLNTKTNREISYMLVSPVEADMAHAKISVQSPVGQALLGKTVGEVAVAQVPAGELKLEILEITR
jgi:transcription elongation factor GreA